MTAPTYDTLTTDDTGADKILTTGTVTALDQNPVSIAQRGTDAPVVQVPVREYKTSGTGATWTIPDGVTAFTIYVLGGGGGGEGNGGAGAAGSNSTVTYNSVTYTGNGGGAGSSGGVGAGGSSSGGDHNVSGPKGSVGGAGPMSGMPFAGGSYGQGGSAPASNNEGGAGGWTIKRITVVGGQTTATYTVGGGGAGGSGGSPGGAGDAGLIVIEY